MSENRKSSAMSKAKTLARRKARQTKDLECGRYPLHSEFVMQQILNHRADYGRN